MTDLSFFSQQLIIGKNFPQNNFLIKSFSGVIIKILNNDDYHEVNTSIIDDRFYWLYSSYGKPLPRTDHVINISDGNKIDNPRSMQQLEPNNQLFAVYDNKTKNFYISNQKQKNFFKIFFKKYTLEQDDVIIKNHYKDIEEFLKEINSVQTISFTGSQNIFTNGGDLMTHLKNIFGYNEPVEFTVEAKYNAKKEFLKEKIIQLFRKQQNHELKKLVCIGKDEQGFEKYFNANNFYEKYDISSDKDNQSLFNEDDVKQKILNKLRSQYV